VLRLKTSVSGHECNETRQSGGVGDIKPLEEAAPVDAVIFLRYAVAIRCVSQHAENVSVRVPEGFVVNQDNLVQNPKAEPLNGFHLARRERWVKSDVPLLQNAQRNGADNAVRINRGAVLALD
jgi:hypothetical protein